MLIFNILIGVQLLFNCAPISFLHIFNTTSIAQCHQLLDERKIDTDDLYGEEYGTPCLQSVLAEMTENVHLGKYSGGWRFLFLTASPLSIITRSTQKKGDGLAPQQEIAQDGSRWWDADFC